MDVMKRIESLDYLRGLMALSVALYHFATTSYQSPLAEDLLGKLGIYAVSVFYVLSGLSLTIVYRERLDSGPLVAAYAVKRLFRIAPLFWLSVTLAVLFGFVTDYALGRPHSVDYWRLFLNYSLLFGFVKPDAYMSTGAWSIGNEMVFYVLLPFLVYFGLKGKTALMALGSFFFALYAMFALVFLDPGKPLAAQWITFINPFNQAFLFVAGVVIGFCLQPGRATVRHHVALSSLAAGFYFFPASGDQIAIGSGIERIALSLICIGFVAAVYVADPRFRNVGGRALKLLGEMSYSVYLLHPFVGVSLVLIARKTGIPPGVPALALLLLAGLPLTLLLSYATYCLLERPMMSVGSRVAARISATKESSPPAARGPRLAVPEPKEQGPV